MWKDLIILFCGFLTALLGLFTTLNIEYEWFTSDSIGALQVALIALSAFLVNAYAIYKNTHVKDKLKNGDK